ncbi:MAG: hypothetical protein ACW98F_08095 [Candidatus Hodarchaeales archaeon]|jgi:hypothetical protein
MEINQQKMITSVREIYRVLRRDRILIFAVVIVNILTMGNFFNKEFLDFEPLQYSLFSYDKILHLLASMIILRVVYCFTLRINHPYTNDHPLLVASTFTMIVYGFLWEPFELLTFLLQESRSEQFWAELFDVPLDWLYDLVGILLSNFLGYE